MILNALSTNACVPCPTCTSADQSDEGCRTDLFKKSQRKGVGYLLIIIAFSSNTYVYIEMTCNNYKIYLATQASQV